MLAPMAVIRHVTPSTVSRGRLPNPNPSVVSVGFAASDPRSLQLIVRVQQFSNRAPRGATYD